MSGTEFVDNRLSMGNVLSLTFGIIGRNLATVATVAFLISLLIIGLSFGAGYALASMVPRNVTPLAAGLGGVIGFFFRSIATGGLTYVAISDLSGEPAGIGRTFAKGLRLALPLVGLSIVVGLGVGLASILLLFPGLMLAMRWAVAVPARVAEGPSVGRSLSRSAELTAGNRWRLFGLFVILIVFGAVVGGAIGAVGGALGRGFGGLAGTLVTNVFVVIAETISTSVSATGTAVCYMELRRLREGATPQQLASIFA